MSAGIFEKEGAAPTRRAQVGRESKARYRRPSLPIKSYIRTIPDYPREGILFRDITALLEDARGLRIAVDTITRRQPLTSSRVTSSRRHGSGRSEQQLAEREHDQQTEDKGHGTGRRVIEVLRVL